MPAFTTRRLTADDIDAFRTVRTEGLVNDPQAFRVSAADDQALSITAWRERLTRDFVVAVERRTDVPTAGNAILGIGGFARFGGTKADHKGLIWGMYVRPHARGEGVADAVMAALLDRRFLRAAWIHALWHRACVHPY
jgi:ribosomal protein S18 acetylase RimI-like enzyme